MFLCLVAVFGDAHAHQSPALASIALIWFRYHNAVARRLSRDHPSWGDQRLFERARRVVIATWQVRHNNSCYLLCV